MKTRSDQNSAPTAKPNYAVLALVAAGALSLGITCTMWWMENKPKPPAAQPQMMMQSPATGADHAPPAAITAGLQPPQAALTLGNWYYDHEQWPLAIQHYEQAIQLGVDNPNVRTDLGNAFRFSDQPQKALQQYLTAQKQDPKHEESLFNQGALYAMSMNQPQKGIEVWQSYLKRFPTGGSVDAAKELITKFKSGAKPAAAKTPAG